MASLNQQEVQILKFLATELRRHGHPVNASTVAKNMVPKTNASEAKLCLEHLQKTRLVASNFDNWRHSGFQITRHGLSALEAMETKSKSSLQSNSTVAEAGTQDVEKTTSVRRSIGNWLAEWTKPQILATILAATIGAVALLYVSGKL